MGKVYFGMTISLDGFVNDRNGNFEKLFASFETNEELASMLRNTGAIVMGRNSFEAGGDVDSYADSYEFQVPLFVLTNKPPVKHPKENDKLTISFVTDGIESAIRRARASAKEKDIAVMGANVGQQLLKSGLVDELQITIAPILLGSGLRLFDHLNDLEIDLEKIRTIETKQQVEIWYKVIYNQS
ncbi:dihydrofolate reductase family protein [Virgibacillus oceani]|uniref:Riboflavin biosynthesis protein RibD n=1 Tax=Virgibacillus oceani TaxID=1479511 RepID=A0A917HFM5_9BACI|nr:dihydrofolate reductase family protein [Virgibacillus oceani]GGG78115.1 riboflavin biosynthesis protein RibD [Virgibacillus oceani]